MKPSGKGFNRRLKFLTQFFKAQSLKGLSVRTWPGLSQMAGAPASDPEGRHLHQPPEIGQRADLRELSQVPLQVGLHVTLEPGRAVGGLDPRAGGADRADHGLRWRDSLGHEQARWAASSRIGHIQSQAGDRVFCLHLLRRRAARDR